MAERIMRGSRVSTTLSVLEWALLVLGAGSAAWYGWMTFRIHHLQNEARQALQLVIDPPRHPTSELTRATADSRVLGEIDIPSIRLSAVVVNTDDDEALGFAVAYLPDTPPPWGPGNSVFAAHRDGLFRQLRNLRRGDEITLTTRRGSLQYRVRRTLVVEPRDVWVLGALPHVDLTLITCFPFTWVGHAPERFIVQAEKLATP
jgi:sortase A